MPTRPASRNRVSTSSRCATISTPSGVRGAGMARRQPRRFRKAWWKRPANVTSRPIGSSPAMISRSGEASRIRFSSLDKTWQAKTSSRANTKEDVMRGLLFAAAITGLTTAWAPAFAQEDADQKFGKVHFATSCNEVAQRRFDRAMRYQHSFWYAESKEIYEEAIKADPDCAIAYWGIALSLLSNPHGAIPAPNLPLGLAAIEKAKAIGARSERERDYIDALSVMYVDYDKIPQQARVQSYLKKMEALAAKYPDDDEAQIFYAITLNVAASPADKTYANQLKGAAILEPIWQRQPQHPGVAHYLIHLYDYPPIAARGLPAALRYAKIAPNAPHAQHMPSHIFTRVGYWKESIAANLASVQAARAGGET